MKKSLRFKRKTFIYPGGKKGVCYNCACKKIPLFAWMDLICSMFNGLAVCVLIDNTNSERLRKIKEIFVTIDNADYEIFDDAIYSASKEWQLAIVLHKYDIKIIKKIASAMEFDKDYNVSIKISGYYDIPNLDYSDYDVLADIICNEVKDVIIFEKVRNGNISISFLETEFSEPQMIERIRMICNDYGYICKLNYSQVRTIMSKLFGKKH